MLDRGRVLESGSHAELMAAGGLYARIFRAQALVSGAVTEPTPHADGPAQAAGEGVTR